MKDERTNLPFWRWEAEITALKNPKMDITTARETAEQCVAAAEINLPELEGGDLNQVTSLIWETIRRGRMRVECCGFLWSFILWDLQALLHCVLID